MKKYFSAFQAGETISYSEYNKLSGMSKLKDSRTPLPDSAIQQFKLLDELNKAARKQSEAFKNLNVSGGLGKSGSSSSSSSAAEKELYESKLYEQQIAKLDQQLKNLDYTKSKLSKNSQAYRDALQQEINLMQQKQKLTHEEAERLRNQKSSKISEINKIAGVDWYSLDDSQKQKTFDSLYSSKKNETQKKFNDLLKEVDSLDKSIVKLGDDWVSWQSKIDENKFEIIINKISEFNEQLNNLNQDTARFKSHLELLIPGSEKYNAKLEQTINSSKQYIQLLQEKQSLIEQELKNERLSISQKDELSNKLRENTNELDEYLIQFRNYLIQLADAQIDKNLETFKKTSNARIEAIQNEIDALKAENEALKEQERIQEKLLAISEAELNLAKAQEKLENVQNEKNTRIFQNGRWEYIADPQNLKNAQDEVENSNKKLLEARKAYYDELEEISKQAQIKELEQQIEAEKRKQEEAEKAAEEKKRFIRTTGEESNKLLEEQLTNSNITLTDGMKTLLGTTSDYVLKMILELDKLIAKQMEAGLQTTTFGNNPTISKSNLPSYAIGGYIPRDEIKKYMQENTFLILIL